MDSHIKRHVFVGILETTSKGYQDPSLWVWRKFMFSPSKEGHNTLPALVFGVNTLKGTAKTPHIGPFVA